MAEVRETELPGVGVRYEFTTSTGEPVSVLVHRTGKREIMVYDRDDPDRCHTALRLSADDALTLVEVLGASRVIASLAAAQQDLAGLAIDWLTVASTSQWVGRADFELHPDDRVVAIGTAEGVAQLERELSGA